MSGLQINQSISKSALPHKHLQKAVRFWPLLAFLAPFGLFGPLALPPKDLKKAVRFWPLLAFLGLFGLLNNSHLWQFGPKMVLMEQILVPSLWVGYVACPGGKRRQLQLIKSKLWSSWPNWSNSF